MEVLKRIRKLYSPTQPSANVGIDKLHYEEYLPDERLRDFIYCYWELRTEGTLEEDYSYRVVADGCIDIFFEASKAEDSFVMGFCKQYTEFPLGTCFHYVGVRFLPTVFPQIFGVDASQLSNHFRSLSEFSLQTSEFIKQEFNRGILPFHILKRFDQYFLETIDMELFDEDIRIYEAIDLILKEFGMLNVEGEIKTGISPRQLRRLFQYYIGASPKSFSKVVRFQNVLKSNPSRQSLRSNKIYYDMGYFDQAHFIRDFKNFYGVTPSKAFDR